MYVGALTLDGIHDMRSQHPAWVHARMMSTPPMEIQEGGAVFESVLAVLPLAGGFCQEHLGFVVVVRHKRGYQAIGMANATHALPLLQGFLFIN